MSISLGKRKRRPPVAVASTSSASSPPLSRRKVSNKDVPSWANKGYDDDGDDDAARAKALFQRAFEAKFRPLEKVETPVGEATIRRDEAGWLDAADDDHLNDDDDDDDNDDDDDDGGASDWSGISEGQVGDENVEIVEFSRNHARPSAAELKLARKGFMSSKPPSSFDAEQQRETAAAKARGTTNSKSDPSALDESDATNLKHDLALQRLLKESHLLDPASFHASSRLEPQGKARLKALDLRLHDLGAKTSVLQQEKMPMAHRKGIHAKAVQRETTRRREAAENGVVLEKKARKSGKAASSSSSSAGQQRRTRGIGGPTVGKFQGGTLRLSARDVRSIEGPRMTGKTSRKGRKR